MHSYNALQLLSEQVKDASMCFCYYIIAIFLLAENMFCNYKIEKCKNLNLTYDVFLVN